ncbi:MAG: DNA-binding protein [Candidatus Omnitrophota bacterium]|nr:DNA-binding protein [Candidatus Omnitrophota bacterium]
MAAVQFLKKLYPSLRGAVIFIVGRLLRFARNRLRNLTFRLLRPAPLASLGYRSRNDKSLRVAVLAILSVFVFQLSAFAAEEISSKALIDNADFFDSKRVLYKGELITAILNRGGHSWINLNDGENAIGVWCRKDALGVVQFIGDYKNKGDVLVVDGIFHRACPVHGGELDIHAGAVNILKHGFALKERVDKAKLNISIALFLAAILMIIVFRKRF